MKGLGRFYRRYPLTVRVPALVALMMIIISAIISERVLSRLDITQERHLEALAETYLDGLSTAVLPAVFREDIWDAYDVLDRTGSIYTTLSPLETVVTGRDGMVLAATDPAKVPVLSALPEEYSARYERGEWLSIDWASRVGYGERALIYQDVVIGAIHTAFDLSPLVDERREVLRTLLLTNAALATIFAFVGYIAARRMVQPVKTLADRMRSGVHGDAAPIPLHEFPRREDDFADLFHGYNALVDAERERRRLAVRLVEEEKLSSLGRLTSSMAHEINNPLGGLFNALDTIKRHGEAADVRSASLALLERGLQGIREVVSAALATYRPSKTGRPLAMRDIDDVRLLAWPELRIRDQTLEWNLEKTNAILTPLSGNATRQGVLNLILNASAAAGRGGTVAFTAAIDPSEEVLTLSVRDTGTGLSDAARDILTAEPGPARSAGSGLGLWMVRRMVDDAGGSIHVATGAGGTTVTLSLPISLCSEIEDAA